MKFLTVDPGESTGYAVWQGLGPGTPPSVCGTAELGDFVHSLAAALGVEAPGGPRVDDELVKRFRGIEKVIMEDWRIYPREARNGALDWDECRTARGIGAMEFICQVADIPYEHQGALIKDAAIAAGAEELFLRPLHPNRHCNDAIMHGVYYKAQRATTAPQEAV